MENEIKWDGPGWYGGVQRFGVINHIKVRGYDSEGYPSGVDYWGSQDDIDAAPMVWNRARSINLGTPFWYNTEVEFNDTFDK